MKQSALAFRGMDRKTFRKQWGDLRKLRKKVQAYAMNWETYTGPGSDSHPVVQTVCAPVGAPNNMSFDLFHLSCERKLLVKHIRQRRQYVTRRLGELDDYRSMFGEDHWHTQSLIKSMPCAVEVEREIMQRKLMHAALIAGPRGRLP